MEKLISYLNEIETNISKLDKKNESVSVVTVGWQIDHVLHVINGISGQLKKSNPVDFKSKFNLKRFLVFTTNHIPRGKAKAPKQVVPDTVATENELLEKLTLARQNIEEIKELKGNYFFRHPYFQDLNVKQTNKFLGLHTFHHLKIIRDIVSK